MHHTGEIASTAAAPAAIGRYFDGVNNEDWDDFRGIWHDDAVVEVVGGIRVQGWDAILPYYVGALQNFPVHYDDPYRDSRRRRHDHGRDRFRRRDLDGVPTTFEAVDVFTLEDGLVRRLTTWYDLDRVLSFTRTPGTPERAAAHARPACGRGEPVLPPALRGARARPGAVAAKLPRCCPEPSSTVAADDPAVSPREITHVCARGAEVVPLARADLAERGRIWAEALTLAGSGGRHRLGLDPSPGLAEGVGRVRAGSPSQPTPPSRGPPFSSARPEQRATGPAGVRGRCGARPPATGHRRVVLQRRHAARAHAVSCRRDRRP